MTKSDGVTWAASSKQDAFLLVIFFSSASVKHLTSSHWAHLSSTGRAKKGPQAECCVFLWWSSLKPPGSNQRSGKHSCFKTKMGTNVTTPIPCLGVSGVSLKYESHKLQQPGDIYTVYWQEGCILCEAAQGSEGLWARSAPSTHTCVPWPQFCQAGWISGRFSSSVPQLLEKGLYQKLILLKSRLWVLSYWVTLTHIFSILNIWWILVSCKKIHMFCMFSDFSIHNHCPQPWMTAMQNQPGWQN